VNKKKLVIFITHSFGEIDVLFPIFSKIQQRKKNVNIELVFCVDKIYKEYLSSEFYQYCAQKLNVKAIRIKLPNKFDFRDTSLVSRKILKFYFLYLYLVNTPALIKVIFSADIIMHEYTNQILSTRPIYFANYIFNFKIYTYRHGHSVVINKNAKNRIKDSDKAIFLAFHKHNTLEARKLGYMKQFIIGYPKFYSTWINMVNNYSYPKKFSKKVVVIYTRRADSFYLSLPDYEYLLTTSFKVIRKHFGSIKIIIKPHPRENIKNITKIINNSAYTNIDISNEHAAVLSKYAIMTISFWTSAILDALSMEIPSVEYFIKSAEFLKHESNISDYKKVGIDSVSTEKELEEFILNLKSQRYNRTLFSDFYRNHSVDFVDS